MVRHTIMVALLLLCSLLNVKGQQSDEDFTMLSAYRDFFSQATDFSLSFARYRPRGYDYRLQGVTWNGVPIENWENGTVSWNILGTISSLNTTTNSRRLTTFANELREGLHLGTSLSNRTYTYKASAGYSMVNNKGWSVAIDVSRRWGESLSIQGVSSDSYSYFATISKESGNHTIDLTMLYAPSERAIQRASTQEAYELTGNNLYNPAWGWQSGKKRNVRQNSAKEPIAMLSHRVIIGETMTLHNTLSARIGTESQNYLTWQNTPNPYPDYYRYMPSYQQNPLMQQIVKQEWQSNQSVSQIDFQNLYNINGYNSPQAKYATEQRRRDLQQYRLSSSLTGGTISGGIEVSYAINRNYKLIDDLMGAEYWLDIDSFVEQDDDVKEQVQNNIRNPNSKARPGDVFGYDYSMTMARASGWAAAEHTFGKFTTRLRGELTAIQYQRTGHFEKENFEGKASYGKSERINNYDYAIHADGWYGKAGALRIGGSLSYRTLSPSPSQLFISREYRNSTLPNSIKEQISSAELYVRHRKEGLKLEGAVYYTQINDKTALHHFYDDNIHQYTHYWMQGISERYVGIELSAETTIYHNLTAAIAIALSDNRYTSNPKATQWRETTNDKIREDETVHYENLHISGSPQNVIVATLRYTPRTFIVNLTFNYIARNFVTPSPLRRTNRSQSDITLTRQEQLTNAATLDLFAGKTFYLTENQSIGIYTGINNILNNKAIRTGGYESYRTVKSAASDSRYYYALGINAFVNITYRF